MPDSSWHEAVRAFAAERHYRADTIERWLRLRDFDAEALLRLALELRLGDNQLRDLWDWAEEIATRLGSDLGSVLEHRDVDAARRKAGSRNDRLKALKAALRRLRFPHLARQEERISALAACLNLPPVVRLQWPEFLEGDVVSVAFDVRSPAALVDIANALAAAARQPECAALFALLDGEHAEGMP